MTNCKYLIKKLGYFFIVYINQQTIEQWRLVFIIAAINLSVSAIVYTIWGTSNVQPWNECGKPAEDCNNEELEKLKSTENNDKNYTNEKIDNEKKIKSMA